MIWILPCKNGTLVKTTDFIANFVYEIAMIVEFSNKRIDKVNHGVYHPVMHKRRKKTTTQQIDNENGTDCY